LHIGENLRIKIDAILGVVIVCKLISVGAIGVRGIRVDIALELGVEVMRIVVVTVGALIVLALV
jgi:hypothetical protein